MKKDTLTLGRAIACLKFEEQIDHHNFNQSFQDDDFLNSLRLRAASLENDKFKSANVDGIPENGCYLDQLYLDNNPDFFLNLFLNGPQNGVCVKLTQHLNNCFGCFQVFTEVIRDYYQQSHSIKAESQGAHHG